MESRLPATGVTANTTWQTDAPTNLDRASKSVITQHTMPRAIDYKGDLYKQEPYNKQHILAHYHHLSHSLMQEEPVPLL